MKKLYVFLFSTLFALVLTAQNAPIDFEPGGYGASWTWTVFENDDNPAVEIIANPDPTGLNGSATVAKFTARTTGNPWAGCETSHGAGIGSWTIDANNSTISILVWKSVISDVGIKLVRNDNWSLGEIKIPNTVTNQWEQITFDFSAHIGNTYDQIVVFPDFQPRTTENIIYFDNLYGGLATSVTEAATAGLDIYPNPASQQVTLRSDQTIELVEVYDLAGGLKMKVEVNATESQLDVTELATGIYVVKSTIDGQVSAQKLIKQ